MGVTQEVVGAGLCLLLVFLSGFWLTRSGKSYKGLVLTIHKLFSLTAVILLAMATRQMNQVSGLSAIELASSVVTGLLFLGTIVTGGLVSTSKPISAAILTMHRVMPFMALLSAGATQSILLGRG